MSQNQNKKIIHALVNRFHPAVGGVETNTLETYSALARSGWEIHVHTAQPPDVMNAAHSLSENYRGLHIWRYQPGLFGFAPAIDWSTADVVCVHNFYLLPQLTVLFQAVLRKYTGRKYFALIFSPHGDFSESWRTLPWIQRTLKKLYRWTLGTLLLNLVVDGVRAVSSWERQQILKKGVILPPVRVVTNGVPESAFDDAFLRQASPAVKRLVQCLGRYAIQIGRVTPSKNQETVIQALGRIPGDLKFVMLGPANDAVYASRLRSLVKTLDLESRVEFLGVWQGADKWYLLKHAVMLVHLSRSEACSNAVLEGMSQGLPCIVADNTGMREQIGESVTGFRVPTFDIQAMAEKMEFVLDHRHQPVILDMVNENRHRLRQFTWPERARHLERFFNECLARVRGYSSSVH